jgi:putative DNA primase/helicase
MLRAMLHHYRQQLAAETSIAMAGKPQAEIDEQIRKDWAAIEKDAKPVGYARALRSSPKVSALLTALSTECSASPEAMADRWPEHLNSRDGIGSLLLPPGGGPDLWPHNPLARMTYLVNAGWNPHADCPQFKGLLWAACGGVEQVYWYLVKALGYALLGHNRQRLLFFLSGPTSNGKSTLLNIMCSILGPQLAYRAKPDLIAKSRYARHARHEASMRGKRLIAISETNDQLDIDEMQVKRLTGEEAVVYEQLYVKTMTETGVSWVIFVANNDMPSILHLDQALRIRIVVIPMGPTIRPELRDAAMARRIIEQERDGVLALLVWGCRAAMADSGRCLTYDYLPPAVRAFTDRYASEQDFAAKWMAERTVWNGSSPQIEGADCYRSLEEWWERGKAMPSKQQFYRLLTAQPGVQRHGDENHARFSGFDLKQDW